MSKPKVETEVSDGCTLEVIGVTWGGVKSKHYYSIDKDNPPKDYRECKRIAGDFDSIESANVIHCHTVSTITTTTKKVV